MQRLFFQVALYLCLLNLTAAGASETAALRVPSHQAGTIGALVAGGGGTTNNWAGYGIDQSTSAASAYWTVPTVSYAKYADSVSKEYSSTWIGIGGNASNDATLIQLGTAQEVEQDGTTKYYAWYDLVAGLSVPATHVPLAISPGDAIFAELKCVSNCAPGNSQIWYLQIQNLTTHNNWSSKLNYTSSMSSVEWIMEASTLPQDGRISDLPIFKSVEFKQLLSNNAQPQLTLATNGVFLINRQGNAAAVPSPPSGNSFIVNQTYVPPPSPLPNHPAWLHCNNNLTDYGQLSPSLIHIVGNFSSFDPPKYYGFHLSHYARLDAYPLGVPPRAFALSVVDDLTNEIWGLPIFPDQTFLDPGYYCLQVKSLTVDKNVPFQIQLSAMPAGFNPQTQKAHALSLRLLELGNLSHNFYINHSRYMHDGDVNDSYQLVPYHQYAMRDWLGPGLAVQWFSFKIEQQCNISIDIGNLYLDAHVSLEDSAGNVFGASEALGVSLTTLLPPQTMKTQVPKGTYYVKIAFGSVGTPGTPFSFNLVGCY